jgi:WD40 repeat protein
MASNDPVRASSVRILDAQQCVIGTGFVVSIFRDNTHALILTSTSVIEHAVSQPINRIRQNIYVTFYVDHEEHPWKASILDWLGSERENACALIVQGNSKLPAQLRTLPLSLASNLDGRKVSIFGYPGTSLLFDGSWQYSEFCRPGPRHRITDDVFLQLDIQNWSDGYKGAPVWDDTHRSVLGMITHTEHPDETGNQRGNIYALPVEILYKFYLNGLKKYGSDIHVRFEKPPVVHNDEPYTEGEAQLFFGYEAVTEKVMHILDKQPKLLAILGPEKSGKTSVIQAGLFPRLRKREIERYQDYDIRTVHLSSKEPLKDLQQQGLYDAVVGLKEAIHRRCQTYGYQGVFLVLDQFEDFLCNCPMDIQKSFLHELLEAVDEVMMTVVIVLRDEFYSLLARHEQFIQAVEQALVNVFAPRTKEQLMSILEQRAEQESILQDTDRLSSLIDQVLENIEQEKGRQSSPLARLNHYLTLEQQHQTTSRGRKVETKPLPISLSDWAEDIFQKLDQQQQQFVKRIVLRVISLGDETLGIPDKKHYASIDTICLNTAEYDLVEELINQRFLVADRDRQSNEEIVTISQDELIREWPRLREWLNEQRLFHSWHSQFQRQLNLWVGSHTDVLSRSEKYLLQDYQLTEAEKWLEIQPEAFDTHACQFVEMSRRKQANIIDELRKDYEQLKRQKAETEQRHYKVLARHLTHQAQKLDTQFGWIQQEVQLAAAAHSLFPSQESDKALRVGLTRLARRIRSRMTKYPIQLGILSRKGRYAIACGCNGEMGDLIDQQWRFGLYLDSDISAMAFSPNGAYLAVAETSGKVHLCFLEKEKEPYRQQLEQEPFVTGLLFSYNERYLVITYWDHHQSTFKVKECEAQSDVYIHCYASRITAIKFNESGNTLVVGYADGLVQVWAVGSKMERPHFSQNYGNTIEAIALSRGGSYLAMAFENREVKITRIGTNQSSSHYQHKDRIRFVLFSPDDRYVVSGSDDSFVKIYDVTQRSVEKAMKHSDAVCAADFSPDGEYLVTASRDNMVHTWNVHQSFESSLQFLQDDGILNLSFSIEKHYLITAGNNSTICIWDIAKSTQCLALPTRVKSPIRAFVWDFNGSDYSILVVSDEKSAERWDFREGYSIHSQPFPFHKIIRKIACSPEGKCLVTVDSNHIPYLWSSLADTQPRRIHHTKSINCLTFSSDGRFLSIGSKERVASIWGIPGGQKQANLSHAASVTAIAFGRDSHFLVTGSDNGEVCIWIWQEGNRNLCTPRHRSKVNGIVVSPDRNHIATTGDDGSVYLWDLEGNHLLSLPIKGYIHAIQFDRNGKYLITGCKDGSAYIWRMTDGSLHRQLSHRDEVICTATSLDGNYLATGSKDRTIGIWEIDSGQQTASLEHSSDVTALAFSPDGKYVAAGCGDGTVKIWLWHPKHLISEVMSRITHVLTEEEWKRYAGDEAYQIVSDLQQYNPHN